ncbi:hypothetical protein M0R72_08175 [Candidatus Pacearchaeota archaeon]|jgi:hypothetical protein|nr:hypothetical protein [Candidatus Pacearchaeota archaeon]
MPLEVITPINEGATATLEFVFKDGDGTAIPVANIATARMTLSIYGTSQVINDRTWVDVRSYFNGSGEFAFQLEPADNQFFSTGAGVEFEYHLATFEIVTTGANPITYPEEIKLKITNLQMIRPIYVRPTLVSTVIATIDPTVVVV